MEHFGEPLVGNPPDQFSVHWANTWSASLRDSTAMTAPYLLLGILGRLNSTWYFELMPNAQKSCLDLHMEHFQHKSPGKCITQDSGMRHRLA